MRDEFIFVQIVLCPQFINPMLPVHCSTESLSEFYISQDSCPPLEETTETTETSPQFFDTKLKESSDHFYQLEKFILNNWDCGAIDLVSNDDLLASLTKLRDFDFTILKSPRWEKDSIIFVAKHKVSQRIYAIKVHENSFKTCRRNYQRHRAVLNNCSNLSTVHGAIQIASASGKSYIVVIYDFAVGITLDQALRQQQLTKEEAVYGLISLSLELKKVDFNVFFKDKTDFIYTENNEIVITDWDKMFQTKNTNSEETISSKCNSFVCHMFCEENSDKNFN